jgi:hypothetical protein
MAAQERTHSSYISRQVAAERVWSAWRPLGSKQQEAVIRVRRQQGPLEHSEAEQKSPVWSLVIT